MGRDSHEVDVVCVKVAHSVNGSTGTVPIDPKNDFCIGFALLLSLLLNMRDEHAFHPFHKNRLRHPSAALSAPFKLIGKVIEIRRERFQR
jgi:hypothetical protein